ncbi:hypothetical protein [Lentzea alba]|nr:hypothetical protein [Lentzea alba]
MRHVTDHAGLERAGRHLHEPLLVLCRWAEAHIAEVMVNREAYDAR